MAETIRDVVIRVRIDQQQVSLKAPDLRPAKAAVEEFEATIASAVEEERRLPSALEDSAREFEESRRKIQDNALKAGEAFKTAGDGAFTLARGIAFMTASSEEDMQKMVQNIAAVQGGFDLFRGTVDTVKGVTEGVQALRAAQQAASIATAGQTAANTALAASNTAVATTGAAAAASMAPLLPILVPLGLAIAAVGGAFFLFGEGAEEIEEATDALDDQRKTVDELADSQRRLMEVSDRLLDIQSQRFALAGQFDAQAQLARITEDARARGLVLQGEINQRLAESESRLEVQLILEEDIQLRTEDRLRTEEQRLRVLDEERRVLADKVRLAEDELQAVERTAQAAEDKLRAARNEFQSAQERFGLLSAEEQLEARRIAAKAPDERTFAETQRFAQLTGGQTAVAQARAAAFERADEAGFADIAREAGLDRPVQEAQRQADQLRQLAQLQKDLTDEEVARLEELRDVNEEASRRTLDLLADLIVQQESNQRKLDELRADFEEYKTTAQPR